MVINVALTGAVPSKQDNPAVPLTPEEIVEDVLACAEAGASVFHIHVHVRDEAGTPVHRQDLDERTSGPIRDAAPELVLCATTSSRVDPAPEARIAGLLADPLLRPDMASLTLGSFNFPRSVSNRRRRAGDRRGLGAVPGTPPARGQRPAPMAPDADEQRAGAATTVRRACLDQVRAARCAPAGPCDTWRRDRRPLPGPVPSPGCLRRPGVGARVASGVRRTGRAGPEPAGGPHLDAVAQGRALDAIRSLR